MAFALGGCASSSGVEPIGGVYSSDPHADVAMRFTGIDDGRVHIPEIVYTLALNRGGVFETSRSRKVDGVRLMDSSLHAGGYDPHEVLQGTWNVVDDRLILQSGKRQYQARVKHTPDGWRIIWDGIEYHQKQNNRVAGGD